MLLKTKGIPYKINEPIVGRVTRNPLSKDPDEILISENEISTNNPYKAILTKLSIVNYIADTPAVYSVETFDHLCEGDIIAVNSNGIINTLYRIHSHQNFLLVTERCNSNCLMCSQPPKDRNDIPFLFSIYKQLIPLIPKDCFEIGITGGEPTLLGGLFFQLLEFIKTQLPDTEVHCLTNGRTFAWNNIATKLGEMNFKRLMLGIPLYSDFYQTHDYIVQAKNAFNQTMQGLYNLASNNQRIEIRIVLHRQSIPRLVKLAKYVYKNLPFVEHIAFMGLEYQGYTPHNIDKLWIDPTEYMSELTEAVEFLSSRRMNVSIYNSQLCLMPQPLWKFSKKSISDWKNIYLEECSGCKMLNDCCGLFASSNKMHSNNIRPFK
ncbi:MAG: His-Xaa-Ser system radical SAM maturase HxsC [Ginsengibacter sp.]